MCVLELAPKACQSILEASVMWQKSTIKITSSTTPSKQNIAMSEILQPLVKKISKNKSYSSSRTQ